MHTLWAKIGWVSIFLKKQIPDWRKWPQIESCQMYLFKIYSSSTIHQTTPFNLKGIFVHSHAHPLSKNWPSQHIFKKLIPNWRKWPQFESCQMYIFKIYSSSTIHQTITFNLKYIFVHFHAHPLSKNWLSQHIFKKRFQIDASDLNLKVAKCIFLKSTPHQQYTRQHPSTSMAYLSTPMHTLWAKIGWVSIFLKKQIPDWRKWPQIESCQMYIFKIYSSSTIHQATPFNLKCIFVHSHAHPLSKNWPSQHIVKKLIPDRPKWPQFERCQMYIFKIYSTSTIHQIPTFNLKFIFVHSHAHPLSKYWLSQHIFKKRFQIDASDLNLKVAKCIFLNIYIWQLSNWGHLRQFGICFFKNMLTQPIFAQRVCMGLDKYAFEVEGCCLVYCWWGVDFENIHLATLKLRSFASIWNLFFENMLTQPILAQRVCMGVDKYAFEVEGCCLVYCWWRVDFEHIQLATLKLRSFASIWNQFFKICWLSQFLLKGSAWEWTNMHLRLKGFAWCIVYEE